MKKKKHEILICGAGMVGMTFALLLANRNINVCIYEIVDKFKLAGFEIVHVGESLLHIGVTLRKSGIPIDWICYKKFEGFIFVRIY
mgnify:CR=1 FL=1